MAAFALTNPYVSLNASDVSDYVGAVTFDVQVDEGDTTTSTTAGWKTAVPSLKSASVQLTFKQDVAASAIDSIMWPLLGTTVAFEVRATRAAVGVSNPKWTGSLVVTGWQPVAGQVGAVAEVSVTFPVTGAVTRATA